MNKPAVTWETLDWTALDRLRDTFLGGRPGGAAYWTSRSDLENYDFTFAHRIAWKWDAVLRELKLRGWTPPSDVLLVSCEVRSSAIHGVPPLAVSSLVACLGIFAIKASVAVAPHVRRLATLRPAKP